jgi:chromosome segregation ATPase
LEIKSKHCNFSLASRSARLLGLTSVPLGQPIAQSCQEDIPGLLPNLQKKIEDLKLANERSETLLDEKRKLVEEKHQAILSCETELAEMKAALASAEATHSSLESTTMEASRAFSRIVTSSRALSGLLDSHESDIQGVNAAAAQQQSPALTLLRDP